MGFPQLNGVREMHIYNRISIYDFACAISDVVDLASPTLNKHHKKVAYLSCKIAQEMNISNNEIQDIILASILHDIGAFSIEDRIKALDFESDGNEIDLNQHALLGYKLLKGFEPLSKAATLIRYHHEIYDESRQDIPIGSYVINLADRVAIQFDEHREILAQIPEVFSKIFHRQHMFHPRTLIALNQLVYKEYVWIEAFSPSFNTVMLKKILFSKEIIDLETLRCFAKVIAQIIDFRSRFTATHSSGVAAVALELAAIIGLPERECKLLEITGFLHDLGKLAVSNDILEKNGPLDDEEFNSIKKHTYYTYAILNKIDGLENIAAWAAYHHERQDGKGYPFHVKGGDFSRLARIIAVADIVTALMENRPYRLGMDRRKAIEILCVMAENGGIDKNITKLADVNFSLINNARVRAQKRAQKEYEVFYNTSITNKSNIPSCNALTEKSLAIPPARAV
jgi:HD-GYP domain-containing protein (c-di-GMP phosphodiesterase class II)